MIVALCRLIALKFRVSYYGLRAAKERGDILKPVEVSGLLRNLLRCHARAVHPLAKEAQIRRPWPQLLDFSQNSKYRELLIC